ncbi:cell wall-active antibiotics response protein LiaF [Paenibacillus thermoaerophilus]|uniref:Cell wall-active antibiotics response protein LiaF n=1 Tax=Paenibacillus thermoaerophilus TaxID=1215385 RepID=A0ABW2V1H7_9BACL|nr:cell wall-active antibiotics response protein LiaF [Paenibacillus thermoaerophilus]TMV18540.1 hypothetical protein FE781_03795 [Paenibacillus thermoaerophilus]
MQRSKRNTALFILAALVFLMMDRIFSAGTMIAVFLLALGGLRLKTKPDKIAYASLIIGVILLMHLAWALLLVVLGLSLFFYYRQTQHLRMKDWNHVRKYRIAESLKWDRDPYVLSNTSLWTAFGEFRIDLSLAMAGPETTLVLQGLAGDVDIFVPEDWGVSVEAISAVGHYEVGPETRSGLGGRLLWRSPNYDACAQKLNLSLSFFVTDVKVKRI